MIILCRRCLKYLSFKGEVEAPGIVKLLRTETPHFSERLAGVRRNVHRNGGQDAGPYRRAARTNRPG